MLLGDLIARFKEESIAEETILGFADLTLLADLRAHAEASGLDLGSFAAAAACRYAAEASHEEWTTLMGAMRRARDPGASYLERALAYAMRDLPVGTAYAVWVGIGAALTVGYGWVGGGEPVRAVQVLLVLGLVGSIVGLKLTHA